jgi:hypothetical protein
MWLVGVLPAAVLILFGEFLLKHCGCEGASTRRRWRRCRSWRWASAVNNLTQIILRTAAGPRRANSGAPCFSCFIWFSWASRCIFLVPRFGIDGAAMAFTLRLLVDTLLGRHLLRTTFPRGCARGRRRRHAGRLASGCSAFCSQRGDAREAPAPLPDQPGFLRLPHVSRNKQVPANAGGPGGRER